MKLSKEEVETLNKLKDAGANKETFVLFTKLAKQIIAKRPCKPKNNK